MRFIKNHRKYFTKPAMHLGEWLIGKQICRRFPDETVLRFRITETEAYGHDDSACYGKNGKPTPATAPLFEQGGYCCVYADMLLIVCGNQNEPDNVLIRKAGNRNQYCDGPISLCKALKIDKTLHGQDLLDPVASLWIEDDGTVRECCAVERVRLGINVNEDDRKKKLRFISI